ncbi:hypothetical protein, partial [Pseudomonas viridiflava]
LDPAAQSAKMELSQSNAMFFCSAQRSKNLSWYRIQPTKLLPMRSENRIFCTGSRCNSGARYNNYWRDDVKQEVNGQPCTSLMTSLLNHLLEVAHHCADFAGMPCFSAAPHSVNRMPS